MEHKAKSQIASLQDACIDDKTSVSVLLRQALMLAITLKDRKYRDIFEKELRGYSDKDSLPTYRTAQIQLLFSDPLKGRWETVTPSEICSGGRIWKDQGKRAKLQKLAKLLFRTDIRMPIAELEAHIKKAKKDSGCLPAWQLDKDFARLLAICKDNGSMAAKLYINDPPSAMCVVPLSELIRIVESLRTNILEWSVGLD